jgi:hypothetical protein
MGQILVHFSIFARSPLRGSTRTWYEFCHWQASTCAGFLAIFLAHLAPVLQELQAAMHGTFQGRSTVILTHEAALSVL